MKSLWRNTVELPKFESLRGDAKTDVLIIGGGMAGILTAYMLEKARVKYILLEADTIASGETGNTTAKITAQHGFIYDKIINHLGVEAAHKYLKANTDAIERYRELSKKIDCDFNEQSSFVYSTTDTKKAIREMEALQKINFTAEYKEKLPIPVSIRAAVGFKNQAQFNPLKFVSGISRKLKIYENTRVIGYDGENFFTSFGKIKSEKTIIATHFPFINKHGGYFIKMHQHRSYVLALEGAKNSDGMYVDEDKKGLSFRKYGDILLLGGGSHRTGKQGGSYKELREFARENFKGSKEIAHFAAQDCMTPDGIAYIGNYSKATDNIYVATGFNKWGMTSSMVAAEMLRDMVLGRKNEYADLFAPDRSPLYAPLAANVFESAINLLTPTVPRCPHLGCALKWNKYERSWDCPCHGSRFDEKGRVLNNPANANMKKIKP